MNDLPEHWGQIRVKVADGYYYRSLEDMEDEILALRAENIRDALGMSPSAWARAITGYVFDSLEREETELNTATNSNGMVFKVGDRVKTSKGCGNITYLQAYVTKAEGTYDAVDLNTLTHYDGPSSEEDAWERVTMDIGAEVNSLIGFNGCQTQMYESNRRNIRHDAYVVLGSVLKIDEEVKARVRGIIERAEKRFIVRN